MNKYIRRTQSRPLFGAILTGLLGFVTYRVVGQGGVLLWLILNVLVVGWILHGKETNKQKLVVKLLGS